MWDYFWSAGDRADDAESGQDNSGDTADQRSGPDRDLPRLTNVATLGGDIIVTPARFRDYHEGDSDQNETEELPDEWCQINAEAVVNLGEVR